MTLLLLLLACSTTAEPLRRGVPMDQHAAGHEAMRAAALSGDLDTLRAAALPMATRDQLRGLDPTLQPQLEALQAAATQVRGAQDLEAATLALGDLGQACADCHAAASVSPPPEAPAAPPEGQALPAQMQRHLAAERALWRALSFPGQDMNAAFALLVEAPMIPSGQTEAGPVPPEAAALELRVHDLAASFGAGGVTPAEGYGRVLYTCASCHGLLWQGPR